MANESLAAIFDEIATALALTGADRRRVDANRRVADILRLQEEIAPRWAAAPRTIESELAVLPGVGRRSLQRIVEFLRTGDVAERQRATDGIPPGVLELAALPELEVAVARTLWQDLGLTSKADLREWLQGDPQALQQQVPAEVVAGLLRSLAAARQAARLHVGPAVALAARLRAEIGAWSEVQACAIGGDLRRGLESVAELDLVAATDAPASVLRRLCEAHGGGSIDEASSVARVTVRAGRRAVPLRLVCARPQAFAIRLLLSTGPPAHLRFLAEEARRNGLGPLAAALASDGARGEGVSPLPPAADDADRCVYAELALPFVAAERRDRVADRAACDAPLLRADDLRAELHAHTTATDGKLGIRELAEAARARGYRLLAITDHSPAAAVARGLDTERLRAHVAAIRRVDAGLEGIELLAGAEVDILADGSLDYEDDVLRQLDIVVASPHLALDQGTSQATERLCRAAAHPLVDILGHPSGRRLGSRRGLAPDWDAVFAAARDNRVAVEINANPARYDLSPELARQALAQGCHFSIDTDAHGDASFDNVRFGLMVARSAGIGVDRCVNAWSQQDLGSWLRRHRGPRQAG